MHPKTHAIAEFETNEDARQAGHTVKLTKPEAKTLYGFNRHERRAELARMRASAKKGKPPCGR